MMSSLARRMATSSLCGASQQSHASNSPNASLPYPTRMEKVKFGIPLESVCGAHDDIPGPLLVMILKLNKEAPFKKDVFRAPGHQANMKKLVHFLQNGRLVNIDNYSVYTIASVLKKFLRKLPNGVFGADVESQLFAIIESHDLEQKRREINRLLLSLPLVTQHLLVLLFGTFRSMATASERAHTGMTSEAIGVSVAPSFFQSCVQDGSKFAKMEDVQRFKVATTIMKFLIDNFGVSNLFGKDNYEYYARISGRVLKIEDNWIFAFKYPPPDHAPPQECQSTPSLSQQSQSPPQTQLTCAQLTLHQSLDDSYARLSMSLEDSLFKSTQPSQLVAALMHEASAEAEAAAAAALDLDELKHVNHYAESTKSLTFLPIVHERQTQRMKTRSEWFLNPNNEADKKKEQKLVRRTSSKEKRLVRKSSSKKDKENGNSGEKQPVAPGSGQECVEVGGADGVRRYVPRI